MNGVIKTYLDSGGYGFISGSDENDYYFSKKDFSGEFQVGDFVKFEPRLGKKGYYAKDITLETNFFYEIPNEVISTEKNEINGYEIVDLSNFIVCASGRGDPNIAKEEIKIKAKILGANALLGRRYFQTTGSEHSNAGNGTHHFTIHNFEARVAFIAKKSLDKTALTKEQLEKKAKIDSIARVVKKELSQKSSSNTFGTILFWAVFILLILTIFSKGESYIVALIPLVISLYIFDLSIDFDSWLREI